MTTSPSNIPPQAVEAAAKASWEKANSDPWISGDTDDPRWADRRVYLDDAKVMLEAAAPHMLAGVEWAIFRASDGQDGTPMESLRYTSREAAQKWINDGFRQPEFWEVRGRAVGTWQK